MRPEITGNLLQCVVCERPLCGTEDLAFFWRANKQGGVEVHLMLKPENKEPAAFIRSPVTEKGAMASWQCACGFKLGDTRAVAVKKGCDDGFQIVVGNAVWQTLHWPQVPMAVDIQSAPVRCHSSQDQRHFCRPRPSMQQRLLEDFFGAGGGEQPGCNATEQAT